MPSAPTKPIQTDSDPLADLRAPEVEAPPAIVVEIAPTVLYSEADRDHAVAVIIAAWHADTTTQGFLHGGGQCGCRYIAGVATRAIMPLAPASDG